jgi:PAS domain S-box-containing protein
MVRRPLPKDPMTSADLEQFGTQRLLDLVIDQVVDYAIFVLDADGKIATWNVGAQRIKGYAPREIIGQPYEIFFSEEDRRAGKPQRILSIARETGRYNEEGWRVRKGGERYWASVVVTALRDRDGVLRGYAKITRDLTDRLKLEEEARRAAEDRAARRQAELDERDVRRSRDELDLILKSITEGVTVQSPDARLVFANDAAARLSGFSSAEEMMATPSAERLGRFEIRREDGTPFPPEELPGRRALAGTASTAIVRFKAVSSGEERWSFVSGAPVRDAAGNVELAVSVFREFTERRRTEEAWHFLAEASAILGSSLDYEATLKQVAELAVPGIADWCSVEVLAADGKLEQLAVAHADPTKIEMARQWRERWPPLQDAAVYKVARGGTPLLVEEVTGEMIAAATPDPEQRQLAIALRLRSAMVVPLVVGQRPFGAVSFIASDSGRRYRQADLILATEVARRASLAIENARAFGEARAALQVRDNFLSVASHELRTPLSALTIIMTSLVRAANQGRLLQLGAEGLRDRMLKGERQTKQLTRLVEKLLDVRVLSSTDVQLERAEVDLAEVAREAIARLEDAATDMGSKIELSVAGPAVGRWDRARIDQVVTNLVGNAIKYAPGSPVWVSIAAPRPGTLELAVADQGPGISEQDRGRVFRQFERGSDTGSPGMGLGLWIVNRIVMAHGGTVTLDGRVSAGARFVVSLPVVPPARASAPPTEAPKASRSRDSL